MRRYLLAAVSVLVVSNSLAAQESLWSGTMTAGKDEINGNRVVGYNRSPAAPVMGELSDAEFDFRGITYRVYSLLQAENNPLLGEWAVLLAFSPLLDHQDLESMMLTVDGTVLHASDSVAVADEASDDPPWTALYWGDPGFRWTDGQRIDAELADEASDDPPLRWTDGQRIDAELTLAQPVPAFPLAAAGLLALLLGVGACRSVASRKLTED